MGLGLMETLPERLPNRTRTIDEISLANYGVVYSEQPNDVLRVDLYIACRNTQLNELRTMQITEQNRIRRENSQ